MSDKKIGRPTDDPKTHQVRMRLSEKEKEKLEYCATETGKTQTEIIREGIDIIYKKISKEKK